MHLPFAYGQRNNHESPDRSSILYTSMVIVVWETEQAFAARPCIRKTGLRMSDQNCFASRTRLMNSLR